MTSDSVQPAPDPAPVADLSDVIADPPPAWLAAPSWKARLGGLAVLLGAGAILGVAVWLEPDTAGLGTHTQLGWTPCGFEERTGLPCATCGMTTATTLAADGRMLASLRVQPAGFLFALAAAICLWVGGWSAWTGRSLTPVTLALARPKVLLTLGLAVILAWGYRIADAMLGHPWTTL